MVQVFLYINHDDKHIKTFYGVLKDVDKMQFKVNLKIIIKLTLYREIYMHVWLGSIKNQHFAALITFNLFT